MNGRIGLLSGVLAAQLLLIAALLLGGGEEQGARALLELDAESVERFTIADSDDAVTLERTEDGWSVGAYPADATKADEVLSKLADLDAPWPVATSAAAAERFEVTEGNAQRHITFEVDGDVAAELFLGTSPGFQRVHARAGGSDDVYAVNFSNFEAPASLDDWLDKTLLAAAGTVQSVTSSSGFSLSRGSEGWLLDGAAADQEAADGFVERFASLRVLGVADAVPEAAVEAATIELVDGAGGMLLTFFHAADEDDYYLNSSRTQGTFRVATYIAEQLIADGGELAAPELPLAEEETGTDIDS